MYLVEKEKRREKSKARKEKKISRRFRPTLGEKAKVKGSKHRWFENEEEEEEKERNMSLVLV